MSTSEITNPARGPWTAVAVDGSGEILVDAPLTAEHLESIVVVRGSAMPVERDGALHLPEVGQRDDVLYEVEHLGDDPEYAPIVWEQAQAVAAALNAAAGHAELAAAFDEADTARHTMLARCWLVPRVSHDENAMVGPHIHGNWIHRSAGKSDAEHTRQYAAQLLAAADELDRRDAEAVTAR